MRTFTDRRACVVGGVRRSCPTSEYIVPAPAVSLLPEDDCQMAALARCFSLLDEITKRCPLRGDERPSFIFSVGWDSVRQTLQVVFVTRIRVRRALDHDWVRDICKVFEKLECHDLGCSSHHDVSPTASGYSMGLPRVVGNVSDRECLGVQRDASCQLDVHQLWIAERMLYRTPWQSGSRTA